jgi:hypothetical protein
MQAQQVLASADAEKITPESVVDAAESQSIEKQQSLEPIANILAVKPELSLGPQPAVRTTFEANQPAFEEQASNETFAVNTTELPAIQLTEQALAYETPPTDESSIPDVVYEYESTQQEVDMSLTLLDEDQADDTAITAESPTTFMTDETVVHRPETIMRQLDETIAAQFEQLEPQDRETTLIILVDIAAAVREISEATYELEPERLAEIEQDLTELCTELLERIGLEPDEETIKWFVQNLMNDSIVINQESASDVPLEEGTHEQLQPDFHILRRLLKLIKSSLSQLKLLGRLAVGLKLLPA